MVDQDFMLDRISIYTGDGLGYLGPGDAVVMDLYDLGPVSGQAEGRSYTVEENFFNSGKGLKISYKVQVPGLIHFGLDKDNQTQMKAGHRYAFELKGRNGRLPIGWYVTRTHYFDEGAAYKDRSIIAQRRNAKGFCNSTVRHRFSEAIENLISML